MAINDLVNDYLKKVRYNLKLQGIRLYKNLYKEFSAKDFKGNTATCEQIVTVTDNQFPVITGLSNKTGTVTQLSGCSIDVANGN